jgi:hypothetical protein
VGAGLVADVREAPGVSVVVRDAQMVAVLLGVPLSQGHGAARDPRAGQRRDGAADRSNMASEQSRTDGSQPTNAARPPKPAWETTSSPAARGGRLATPRSLSFEGSPAWRPAGERRCSAYAWAKGAENPGNVAPRSTPLARPRDNPEYVASARAWPPTSAWEIGATQPRLVRP